MPCDCISYNRPEPWQKTEETILTVPAWIGGERQTVGVDACIADHVQALWDAGIWTHASCCGHNERKGSVIVYRTDHQAAQSILQQRGADIDVLSWQLRADVETTPEKV